MPTTAFAVTVTPPVSRGFFQATEVRIEDAANGAGLVQQNPGYLTLNGDTPFQERTRITEVTTLYFVSNTPVRIRAWIDGDDVSSTQVTPGTVASPAQLVLQPQGSGPVAPAFATEMAASTAFSSRFVTRATDASLNTRGAGTDVLASVTTGTANVGLGRNALKALTTSTGNVAIGDQAGESITIGVTNVAVGWRALRSATTPACCVAVGPIALENNTSGEDNTGVGSNALVANTTGHGNTAIGTWALQNMNGVSFLTALGFGALRANTTGTDNTALGANALQANTTAGNQTAVGRAALLNVTTGGNNTAIGASSLASTTTGTDNVAIGVETGLLPFPIVAGIRNVYIGTRAGANTNTDPSFTTAIGYAAQVAGANATAIGYAARALATGSLAIGCDSGGNGATTSTANEIRLGTISHTTNIIGNASIGGSGRLLGFLGATPVARPAVTGSRGGNAALASLLTQLATLGLITDSTTA